MIARGFFCFVLLFAFNFFNCFLNIHLKEEICETGSHPNPSNNLFHK